MKNKERFDRAITALVKAFFEGTLAKGNCQACAVGNIVAHCNGVKTNLSNEQEDRIKINGDFLYTWNRLFMTFFDGENHFQLFGKKHNVFGIYDADPDEMLSGLRVISKTAYSQLELAKVEYAFETNTKILWKKYLGMRNENIMEDQYNGLMAVVDILCEIEGVENATEVKELFAWK